MREKCFHYTVSLPPEFFYFFISLKMCFHYQFFLAIFRFCTILRLMETQLVAHLQLCRAGKMSGLGGVPPRAYFNPLHWLFLFVSARENVTGASERVWDAAAVVTRSASQLRAVTWTDVTGLRRGRGREEDFSIGDEPSWQSESLRDVHHAVLQPALRASSWDLDGCSGRLWHALLQQASRTFTCSY